DHQLGLQGLPLGRALVAPAARATRRVAGEARWRDQLLEPPRQVRTFGRRNAGGEAHVVELAVGVVEAEQQGAHDARILLIAEAADDAVGAAQRLHLEHRALAGLVAAVETLRDDAVERAAGALEPALGFAALARIGAETEIAGL